LKHQAKKYIEKGMARPKLLVVLVVWLAILGLIAGIRQPLFDWWQLRGYKAPTDVSALSAQDTMTDYGRKVFYVNHPAIDSKQSFRSVCPNGGGEQTIVLGCYHGNQRGIYLLDVTDSRLNGVEQVTAAHEMLHAAYDRLSSGDRNRVNTMLQDYYDHDLHDQRIIDTINAYRKSEPNDVVNEMHSIFGTEIVSLPSELETYYKKYFTDRSQVAAFAARYQSEFTSRQAAVERYDMQLAALKQQIKATNSDLEAKASSINSEQKRLVGLRSSGNIDAYNAGVPVYNQLIDTYNAELRQLQVAINQYNQLVTTRNAVALEQDELVNELSTQATPINK
jgi:hypothetical protein